MRTPMARQPDAAILHLLILCAGVAAGGLHAALAGQESDYDLLNYHYYVGYAFLTGRAGFDYAPAQLQSFLNPLPFVPLWVLVQHLRPTLVGIAYGCFHGLALPMVFAIAFRLLAASPPWERRVLSIVCAVGGVYGPVLVASVGSSSSDALLDPLLLGAVFLLVAALSSEQPFGRRALAGGFLPAGFLLGAASGLKLVETVYAAGAVVALLGVGGAWRRSLAALASLGAGGVAGFALTNGFWMHSLWTRFRNPFFPLFNATFRSPYYEPVDFADRRFLPGSFGEHFLRPFHALHESAFTSMSFDFRDGRYAVICVLLIGLAVRGLLRVRRHRSAAGLHRMSPAAGFLVVFFVASYILWQTRFSVLRYAITLESLGAIVIVLLLQELVANRRLRYAATAIAIGFVLVAMRPCRFSRSPWGERFIEVDTPQFRNPGEILVVLAHNQPLSFVVPYFQPEVRFVSVRNNFTAPDRPTKYQEEVRAVLREHPGSVLLLALPFDFEDDAAVMRGMGWAVTDTIPLPVAAPISSTGLGLWPLGRIDSDRSE